MIAIHEHYAALIARELVSPRMKELNLILAGDQPQRKKTPGHCRFCGHGLESGLAVRKHERICRARPTPRRKYPKRNTTAWTERREKYLLETGSAKEGDLSYDPRPTS